MDSMTQLTVFFREVYRPLKLRGKSANTTRLYEATFASMRRLIGREPTIGDISDDLTVTRYLELLSTTVSGRTGRRLSPYTVEKQRTQICAMARLAFDRGILTGARLAIAPETLPERTPEAWTHEEMVRVFDAAKSANGRIGKLLTSAVMPALISFIYDTGERVTACLEALRDDYHRPHCLVRAEARKGKKKDKLFRLSDETCDLLDAIVVPSSPMLITIPPSQRARIWPIFGEIVEAAGLAGGRSSKFHKIRRTVASAYAAAGQDSSALLGHSSKRITERYYLDPKITGGPPAPCDVLQRLGKPHAK
jgi:integrase